MERFYINDEQFIKITSCLNQHIKSRKHLDKIYTITIWFSETANRVLKSNTKPNEFLIMDKTLDGYRNPILINKITQLWISGLVPIEVINNDGIGCFFALPRIDVDKRSTEHLIMLFAETEIPMIEEFYF